MRQLVSLYLWILIFVLTLQFGMVVPARPALADDTSIVEVELALFDFVSAVMTGERDRANHQLDKHPMFKVLRDSGEITPLHQFVQSDYPRIEQTYYPKQRDVEIARIGSFIRANSIGQVRFLAKFQPSPAILSFTVYKPKDKWAVLSMRFLNKLEQLDDEIIQLLAEPERPEKSFQKGMIDREIARLNEKKRNMEIALVELQDRLKKAQAFLNLGSSTMKTTSSSSKAGPAIAGGKGVLTKVKQIRTSNEVSSNLATTSKSTQSVKDGVEAYHSGEYQRAFEIWQNLAKTGHAKAQFHLGGMLFEGRIGSPDIKKARYWLNKATAQQYRPAFELLEAIETSVQNVDIDTSP